jgi:hypothetical protein
MVNSPFEGGGYILVNVILLFLLINFNLEIGTIYGFMALFDLVAYYIAFDRSTFALYPIEKDKNHRFLSLVYAMGAYVAFTFFAAWVVPKFTNAPAIGALSPIEYISSLVAGTFSSTPILYSNIYMKIFVWGCLIAILETRSFFRTSLQWGLYASKTVITNFWSVKTIFVCAFFGGLFMAFHILAKGITNNSGLLVTFLFGALSVGLVLFFKEVLVAIFLHIINNTLATVSSVGISLFGQEGLIILGVILVISWFLLFFELPLIGQLNNLKKLSIGG